MIEETDDTQLDEAVRALSHTTRRAIIRLTANEDVAAMRLAELLQVAPATASEHLRVLRKTRLVILTADGTWRRYRADLVRVQAVLDAMRADLWDHPSQPKEPT